MKNFAMILLAACATVCCGKPKEPVVPINVKIMPAGFEALAIGSTKEEVGTKVPLTSEGYDMMVPYHWQGLGVTVYNEDLEDKVFDTVELAFKADRLAGAHFTMRPEFLNKDGFNGIVSALNEKLGCKGDVVNPGEFHRGEQLNDHTYMVRYGHCIKDTPADDCVTTYTLKWSDRGKYGLMTLHIYSNRSMDWVPAGKKVSL